MTDESSGGGATADGGASGERLLPKGRLEASSDGVFAIVVTLLVLELRVPDAEHHLWKELADEWPAFLGYIVSFAFIGSSWIAHSTMTRFINSADGALLRLNLCSSAVLLGYAARKPGVAADDVAEEELHASRGNAGHHSP